MDMPEPQKQHHWLQKLVGEWTFESECGMGPDQPPMQTTGTEVVRSLGGLWTVGEGTFETPGHVETPGQPECRSIMTLGYDPQSGRFIGTFIASMMTHLWPYNGSLDAAERVLTLDSEGPSFTGEGMAKYQDIIEFITDDHRVLRSQVQGPDGQWQPFMKADYRRKK